MKYYRIINQRWVKTKFDPSKRQVKLYNDDFTLMGIGLY